MKQLIEVLKTDAIANNRHTLIPRFFGDEIWKFQVALRALEFCDGFHGCKRWLLFPIKAAWRVRYHHLSVKLGFSIPTHVFAPGLSIPHYGTIVVSKYAKIGKNCRIHEGVNIGATNGTTLSPVLGNNVFLGSGAKLIGEIQIADDVCIGANAVVTKSITESGTTWAGNPAQKISNNSSRRNLSSGLFLDKNV